MGSFNRHLKTHEDNILKESDQCDYRGNTKNLYQHKFQSHKSHVCTTCGKQLSSKTRLNQHLLTHKGFHYGKCEFTGKTESVLDNHIKKSMKLLQFLCATFFKEIWP